MTFAEFQQTGRPAMVEWNQDEATAPGRLYAHDLWILDSAAMLGAGRRWLTITGYRECLSDDLIEVERFLYAYALAEGITLP